VAGLLGALAATGLIALMAASPQGGLFLQGMKISAPIIVVAVLVGAVVGFVSSFIPAYNASRQNIVEGLRHIG